MAVSYEEALMFQEAAQEDLAYAEEWRDQEHGRFIGFIASHWADYRKARFEQASAVVHAAATEFDQAHEPVFGVD